MKWKKSHALEIWIINKNIKSKKDYWELWFVDSECLSPAAVISYKSWSHSFLSNCFYCDSPMSECDLYLQTSKQGRTSPLIYCFFPSDKKIWNGVFFWEIAVKIPSQKTHSEKSNLQNRSENPIPENALWEI